MYYPIVGTLLPLMALQCAASSVKPRTPYKVKSNHPIPSQWQKLDRAPADHRLEMRIGLTQSRFNDLERELYEGNRNLDFSRSFTNPSYSLFAFQLSLWQTPFTGRYSPTHHSS